MTSDDWIPVKERIPDNDDMVLITYKQGIACAYCRHGWWYRDIGGGALTSVTAWQPLPKAYVDPETVINYDYLKEDGWILVTEDLPKEMGFYQIAYQDKKDKTKVKFAKNKNYWSKYSKSNSGFEFTGKVVAWKPNV